MQGLLTDPLAFFLLGTITGGACTLLGCIAWYFWDSPDSDNSNHLAAPHICTFSWRRDQGFVCDRCDRRMVS